MRRVVVDITVPQQAYNAAKPSRFRAPLTGVSPMGSHADFHYRSEADYLRIMEWARNTDRNDQIVGQGITRLVDNVLQDGLCVDPDTGIPEADTYLREKFENWGEDAQQCHLAGELTLQEQAKLVLRAVVVDGDIVVLPTRAGSLQPIEAHRIRTPRRTTRNVVHGVLMDENRKRVEYWITKEDISAERAVHFVNEITPVRAYDRDGNRQVFHVYNPKRVSQTRGVSTLAPIMDTCGMHDDVQFANLVKQQIASCVAFLRERGADFEGSAPGDYIDSTSETLSGGTTRTVHGVAPGMEITGAKGEVLKAFSPNIPNAEFFPHAQMIQQFIAINLGLPLQMLLLDGRQTNFSGWRGAVDQARLGMKSLQCVVMRNRFYRPTYLWKVRDWIATDPRVRAWANTAGPRIFQHSWGLPTWAYIQPMDDIGADALAVDEGMNSRREILAKRGIRIEDVDRDQIADRTAFILSALKATQQINQQFPEAGVTWRDFDQGGRVKAALAALRPQQEPQQSGQEQNSNAV